jgi:17beta-estradiol 17-dehydrogenase / very-long-chain 3-oxoacyl-CoA reductase
MLVVLSLVVLAAAVLGPSVVRRLRASPDWRRYGAKTGGWALITGASEGIGKAFAEALAKRGFNVIVAARSRDKLTAISEDIGKRFGVETLVVPIDASQEDAANVLYEKIKHLSVRILVNNVGVTSYPPVEIAEMELGDIKNMIQINCTFTTQLTSLVVRGMKTLKKPCGVMMLSSFSARAPVPLLSVYAATKAFDDHLGVSLAVELEPYGITVSSFTPSFIATSMSGTKRTSTTVISPEQFVRDALAQFGGAYSFSPHLVQELMLIATTKILPQSFVGAQARAATILSRKKILKKQATAKGWSSAFLSLSDEHLAN